MQDRTRQIGGPAIWLALLVLVAAPLILPTIPPLVDLPGHMGAYQIAQHHGDGSPLDRFFDHHWQVIGNLGVELLMRPLGVLLGVEAGIKLVVVLIPVLMALGFLLVAREGHGRVPATTLFALPFVYSYPFHYGVRRRSRSCRQCRSRLMPGRCRSQPYSADVYREVDPPAQPRPLIAFDLRSTAVLLAVFAPADGVSARRGRCSSRLRGPAAAARS